MQIKVTGRDISLTRALKDYVEKRMERIERHIPRIIEIAVILRRERQDHVVDVKLNAANLHLKVSGRSPDMYASIDDAVDKLERSSRRKKERRIDGPRVREIRRRAAGVGKRWAAARKADDAGFDAAPMVSKRVWVKPMSVEEAMLQLKLFDFQFFVFRDSEDGQMKVIYRRDNGTFGLIEPGGQ